MPLFFVAYDLDKPGQDYQDLWDELESLGAKRVQDSVWALRNNGSATSLRDTLKQHMDTNDRLLVIEEADWSSRRAMTEINKI